MFTRVLGFGLLLAGSPWMAMVSACTTEARQLVCDYGGWLALLAHDVRGSTASNDCEVVEEATFADKEKARLLILFSCGDGAL